MRKQRIIPRNDDKLVIKRKLKIVQDQIVAQNRLPKDKRTISPEKMLELKAKTQRLNRWLNDIK